MNMEDKILLGLIVIVTSLHSVQSQVCTDGQWYGDYRGPFVEDTATNMAFLATRDMYTIPCCGVIKGWQFERIGTGSVNLQIFRQVAGTWTLVGQNLAPSDNDGPQTVTVSAGQQIAVEGGETIGWDNSVVSYKGNGNEDDNTLSYTYPGPLSVGDTISVGTPLIDHSYAIQAQWGPGNSPTVTSDTVTITNVQVDGVIHTVVASDVDLYDAITITDQSQDGQFVFDPTDNSVTLTGLTYASGPITLTYRATDQCGNIGTGTLTVNIINPAPYFTGSNTVFIHEDTILETLLFDIGINDPNDPNLSCTFAHSAKFRNRFVSNNYTISSVSNPAFDYQTTDTHTITATCTDTVTSVSRDYYVYLIENEPPYFLNLQDSVFINSNHGVDTVIYTVLANDTESDTLDFTLACLNPPTCCFYIGDDGNVYCDEDLTTTTVASYDVSITVSDPRHAGPTSTLTINVADLNHPVTLTGWPVTVYIHENNALNDKVYDIQFIDIDVPQTHTFAATPNPVSGSFFDVAADGSITLNQIINYETLPTDTYVLDVTVWDPLTSDTGQITVVFVNVNEAPSFGNTIYTFSVNESDTPVSLGTPNWGITDPDANDYYNLTMTCGSALDGYFLMDGKTGEITIQSGYDTDAGLSTTVVCDVNVTDAGGLYDTAQLYIYFEDINDNNPRCSATNYQFFLDYYAKVSTDVGSTPVTDADSGLFGSIVSYRLDQSSLGGKFQFAINSAGNITLAIAPTSSSSALNYSDVAYIEVIAEDGGGRTTSCSVTIYVGPTTTLPPTTTTWRYLEFWEWPANVAWFVVLMLLLLLLAAYLLWLCCTCHGEKGCEAFLGNLRRRKGPPRQFVRREPRMADHGSVRRPPPPEHTWKHRPPSPPPPSPPPLRKALKVAYVKVARKLEPRRFP